MFFWIGPDVDKTSSVSSDCTVSMSDGFVNFD